MELLFKNIKDMYTTKEQFCKIQKVRCDFDGQLIVSQVRKGHISLPYQTEKYSEEDCRDDYFKLKFVCDFSME